MRINRRDENKLIREAISILENRMKYGEDYEVTKPDEAKDYLHLKMRDKESEVFAIMFLDNRHSLIRYIEVFHGTIDGASVFPREIVKLALKHNAAAAILAHNHPSGESSPSNADIRLTNRLKDALALIDVRVLDHIIVGKTCYSFGENGII